MYIVVCIPILILGRIFISVKQLIKRRILPKKKTPGALINSKKNTIFLIGDLQFGIVEVDDCWCTNIEVCFICVDLGEILK